MTVAAEIPLALYDGDGVTMAFPAPWRYLTTANLLVELIASDGTVTLRMLGTHYAASAGATDAGGTVTMVTAPAVGQTLRIRRVTPLAQQTQYPTSGNFPAKSHELALDRLTLIAQEQAGDIDDVQGRALQVPFGEVAAVLPAMAARANKFAAFDSAGALVGAVASPGVSASGTLAATTRIVLANLSIPSAGVTAWLSESGRFGLFEWMLGNFTALVAADPLQGIYVPSVQAGYGAGVGCWVRRWAGFPRAEWFGAQIDNGAYDSGPALQACLNLTGKLYFPKGLYYGTTGLVDTTGCIIIGEGVLFAGYVCSSPTAHLLSNQGVAGVSFATGGDYSNFTLARSVTPTTPADPNNDRTQGHGLHIDMTSNTRIHNVFTYNNLVELYHSRTLALQVSNIRGLRQTGGAADRWYGYYCYGDPTGMPGGWATGPSGNPSCTIKKVQMVAAGTGSAVNFKFQRHLQDLWCEDMEAGGGYIQFDIDPQSYPCNDFFLIRPVADGYLTHGIKIKDMPLNGCAIISHGWVAPSGSATSSGIDIDGGHGLEINCKGDFGLASGLRGVNIANTSRLNGDFAMVNCQYPVVGDALNSGSIKAHGYKNYASANFGDVITLTNSNGVQLDAVVVAIGVQKYLSAVKIDAASYQLNINVTRVFPASVVDKIVANGAAITTQGNVGNNHVIISPGAGAML